MEEVCTSNAYKNTETEVIVIVICNIGSSLDVIILLVVNYYNNSSSS